MWVKGHHQHLFMFLITVYLCLQDDWRINEGYVRGGRTERWRSSSRWWRWIQPCSFLKKQGTSHKSLRRYDVSISVMYYRDLLQLKWCLKVWQILAENGYSFHDCVGKWVKNVCIKNELSVFPFIQFVGKCLSIKGKGALEGIAYLWQEAMDLQHLNAPSSVCLYWSESSLFIIRPLLNITMSFPSIQSSLHVWLIISLLDFLIFTKDPIHAVFSVSNDVL